MPNTSLPVGPLLVGAGLVLVVVGLLAWAGWLSWFGRLPGDVRVDRGPVRVYAPFASTLVVSAALTLVASVVRRLVR